jgi:2-haloacid dehalogenase/putative hydrolase of the HAD superfamily
MILLRVDRWPGQLENTGQAPGNDVAVWLGSFQDEPNRQSCRGPSQWRSMPEHRFDALLIDFYGTIAAGDHAAVESACLAIVEACGLPLSAAELAIVWGERFFATIDASNHDSFRTLYECELISLRETLAGFGKYPDPKPFVQSLEDYWREPPIHEDALELLSELNRAGVPVCCVSNADCEALHAAISRHGLRFDHVVCSELARCYKPEEGIFRQALENLGLAAQRVIHVGDSLHSDIGGALKLGINAAWICREQRIHDIGQSTPWRTVSSLDELRPLLL